MADENIELHELFSSDCCYYDLNNLSDYPFNNSVLHLNVRSLQNKVNEIEALLTMLSYPKALMLTETWLRADGYLVSVHGYSFVSSPRVSGPGGGVGIYLHDTVHYQIISKSSNHNFTNNIDYILITLSQFNVAICCMYCPPQTKLIDIMHAISALKEQVDHKFRFVVTGDFNINMINDTNLSTDFLNEMHALSLHPAITLPTRVTDNTATLIDNFMCDFSLLPVRSCVVKTDISDHYLIALLLSTNITNAPVKVRNFSATNKLAFSRNLATSNWDHLYELQEVDKAFGYFIKKLKRIYNKSFPYISVNSHNNKSPWLTSGILKSIRHKNKLYVKMKNNQDLKLTYNAYRNRLCKIIRFAKQQYYKNILTKFKNNSAKLWKHLNSVIKPKENSSIPIDPNVLNDYFTSVFKQAPIPKETLSTIPNELHVADSFFLTPVTYNEIINTMNSLSNSHAIGSDGINPIIIKDNISCIASHLLYIFNMSFANGVFPKMLKNAIVTPVFKSGTNTDPSNYRPISILTIFSKLLEKLFYTRLIGFVNGKNILHSCQFGFRANHSTNLAIAHVVSSLISKINSNNRTVLALLDLRKAFDLINHKLLLNKLNIYGIRGLPLQWLSSYLNNRYQCTKVNNILSNSKPISAGVPQGSIIGPLLFILFINDLFQFNSLDVEIYLYADDTAVIFHATNDELLQLAINKFFQRYCNWCDNNGIVINPNKSNYLSFNGANVVITINGWNLENPSFAKYLGVYIDNNLFWNYHVDHVLKLCCQRIGMFKRVLEFLPSHVVLLYYNAFILSCFSYCITFWFNNDRSGRYKLVNKIDSLLGTLAKRQGVNLDVFIANSHLCNVNNMYNLQCLSFMYDICNSNIYVPFIPLITNNAVHKHYTRNTINIHISNLSSLDRRNFVYHCTLFWNSSPVENRKLPKNAFIRACKSLLNLA